jgi:anthranilate phosphoribosyltransferase
MSNVSIRDIVAGRVLTALESKALMHSIAAGDVPPAQVAALLTTLSIRGLDVDHLDGFSAALRELAVPLDLGGGELIDVCGTGGDGKSSFNISTTVAFVLAGAGYRVAKHGNVAVSSLCGSSNVLQELGVALSADPEHLRRSLDTNGVCFIHAPLFHPALKRVAPIRQELGFRTVFNALGPLVNPAAITYRYTGVYNFQTQRLYSYLLRRRGQKFAVVHTHDGYDEISLTSPARVVSHCGAWEMAARDVGSERLSAESLASPPTTKESAQLVVRILQGQGNAAQMSAVLANAAVALWCYEGATREVAHYRALASDAISSGRAYRVLEGCREV